jgi:hypothetical protein
MPVFSPQKPLFEKPLLYTEFGMVSLGTGWYCVPCARHLLGDEIVDAYLIGPCQVGCVWLPELRSWLDVTVVDGSASMDLSGYGCCQCLYTQGWRVVDSNGAHAIFS